MKGFVLLFVSLSLLACGGGGGSGGGGTTPPPPPTELAAAPPGIYSGIIDWTGQNESCTLTVHENGTDVTLALSGSSGVSGTLISKRLSLLGPDQFGNSKSVSIWQTQQGNVQIFRQEVNDIVINVSGPQ